MATESANENVISVTDDNGGMDCSNTVVIYTIYNSLQLIVVINYLPHLTVQSSAQQTDELQELNSH